MQQFSWSKGLCIACCSISILVRLATPFPSLVLLLAGNSGVLVEGRRLKDKHYYISECKSCLQLLAIPIIAIVAFSTPYVILKNTAIPPDPVPPGYSSQLWYYLLGYYDYFYHGYPLFQYDAHHLFFLGFGLLMLTGLRDYMGFLCLAGLALGSVAAVRPGRLVSTLAGGTVMVLFLSLLADRLDLFPAEELQDPFATATSFRSGLQQGAGSAFGTVEDTETLGGSLRYLPLGFSFLLFGI